MDQIRHLWCCSSCKKITTYHSAFHLDHLYSLPQWDKEKELSGCKSNSIWEKKTFHLLLSRHPNILLHLSDRNANHLPKKTFTCGKSFESDILQLSSKTGFYTPKKKFKRNKENLLKNSTENSKNGCMTANENFLDKTDEQAFKL